MKITNTVMTILMRVCCFVSIAWRGATRGFGDQGRGHLFQGNRGTKSIFEGTGLSTIMENRKHKKTSAGPRGAGVRGPPLREEAVSVLKIVCALYDIASIYGDA